MNAELSGNNLKNNAQNNWYFMDTGARDGSSNMAIDEFLATEASLRYPLLRVYQWKPYTISLGYNQRAEDIDFLKCQADGIGLVRRPTGGRAVLHAEEVTYAVIIPKDAVQWYQNSVLAVYNFISQALVVGLNKLGISVKLEQRKSGNISYAARTSAAIPCFSASAQYEVMFDDQKLIGSAQRRFSRGVLQHGSILTGSYHLKLPAYLKIGNQETQIRLQKSLEKKTISISQILNHPISHQDVVKAIVEGFKEKYNISFQKKEFTPRELSGIAHLRKKNHNLWR